MRSRRLPRTAQILAGTLDRVQGGEREARKHAEFGVREGEFVADGLEQDAHHLLVEEVERRQGREKREYMTARTGDRGIRRH